MKERTPGYCDRILYRSLPDTVDDLVPESVPADLALAALPDSLKRANTTILSPTLHNYRAVNDGEGMSISDHSPVFGTFLLRFSPKDGLTTMNGKV